MRAKKASRTKSSKVPAPSTAAQSATQNAKKPAQASQSSNRFATETRGRWWLIVGLAAYALTALISTLRTIPGATLGNGLYALVDWFAACLIYFFLLAPIGWVIDWWLARRNGQRLVAPLWLFLIAALYLSSVAFGLWLGTEALPLALILFFPFAFGVFFPAISYTLLFPTLMQGIDTSSTTKLVLDFVLLGAFGWWLRLSWQRAELTNRQRIVKLAILILLFIVLFAGLAGCAVQLANPPPPLLG